MPIADTKKIADKGKKLHFIDDPIKLIEREFSVSNQWGAGNIEPFIELAGYTIETLI